MAGGIYYKSMLEPRATPKKSDRRSYVTIGSEGDLVWEDIHVVWVLRSFAGGLDLVRYL